MNSIKLTKLQALQLIRTNKDFLVYDLNHKNKLTRFTLTNDLQRHKNNYTHFKVLSCCNIKLKELTINF